MPLTGDIAAFAKREHVYRTRLAGLMLTLVLALAITILPTFKSQLTSSTSDSRLLSRFDLCNRERDDDDCRADPNKDKPGVCGCGVPDTDTDGDGALDCQDGCPDDASKKNPGICGCGVPEIYTDKDEDDTPDCIDECIENDPVIKSHCENSAPYYDCEGCAGKYYRTWMDCGKLCLDYIDYCIIYSFEVLYVYVDRYKVYRERSRSETIIQSGAGSSNSVFVYTMYCHILDGCEQNYYLNNVSCIETYSSNNLCLQCGDANKYCYQEGVPPSTDNPYFYRGDEGWSLLRGCFYGEEAITSELQNKPLPYSPGPHHMRTLFRHGA